MKMAITDTMYTVSVSGITSEVFTVTVSEVVT